MPLTDVFSQQPPFTVLVVDDDPAIVELLRRFLTKQGLDVVSAYDGQQCLEVVQRGNIDAIVLDIMMPGMSGLAVCVTLRKLSATQSTPIIFLTAYDDPEIRLAGTTLGGNAFLVKPIRGQDLLACLHSHLAAGRHNQLGGN
ncbi:MAG: response regulator [Candidatus Binatia bacterium]|nr:response regulator [Candidatus Binatia bacterium]